MDTDCPLVLLIDDDIVIRRYLETVLPAHGYRVALASTGSEGLTQAAATEPGLILLDLGLPDMEGAEVARRLREWTSTPIIVLSTRGNEEDKVAALDSGADDYLTKPIGISELTARFRAALRRVHISADSTNPIVTAGNLKIDLHLRRVSRSGTEIHLTPIEFKLLATLVRRAGQVVTREKILKEVWGPQYGTESNYLRVYMKQLRDKLEADPTNPRHLHTEPGVGYRFIID